MKSCSALSAQGGGSDPENNGAPGEIRTPDLLVRSQALYPTELRAHITNKRQQCRQKGKEHPRPALFTLWAPPSLRGKWRRGRDYSSLRSSPLRGRPCGALSPLRCPRNKLNPTDINSTIWWRRGRDSNPRWAFDPYALSRGAPSTTRPPLPSGNAQIRARDDTRRGSPGKARGLKTA